MKILIKNTLFLFLVILLFTSCYHDYLIINSEFKSCKVTQDSSKLIFFHIIQAGQPPKGISKFPDGGTQKVIFKNVSLYSYDIKNEILNKLFDFGNLPRSSWVYDISLQKNKIVFGLRPLMGWNWFLINTSTTIYKDLYDKFMGLYLLNLENNSINHFTIDGYYSELSPDESQILYLKEDSLGAEIWNFIINENKNQLVKKVEKNTAYIPLYWINNDEIAYKVIKAFNLLDLKTGTISLIDEKVIPKQNDISIKKIKELTANISYNEWGFNLNDHWGKNKKELIRDIVLLNGNFNYRKAIIEILSKELSKQEVKNILTEMKNYENTLEGYKKSKYEMFSKDTKDLLKSYLN